MKSAVTQIRQGEKPKMSGKIIECVPNFSEGRRPEVIEAIVAPFRGRQGFRLLDYRADADHNRLVVSLAGEPGPMTKALLEACEIAVKEIDLNMHQGGHPRIGAVDVIPFVPVMGIDMKACVDLAREFGMRFYDAFKVPVYYYEEAANNPQRKNLEKIRKGQFEGLKTAIKEESRRPDLGPAALHPTAGATVIGARKFLIAFNVNLKTDDIEVAQKIAQYVRASSGGFCHVKGIGLVLKEKGMVQVSMNLVDFQKNALYRVVEMIRMEAARWGVSVAECEVYGMIPAQALLDSAAYYLQLNDFKPEQVVELALLGSGGEA